MTTVPIITISAGATSDGAYAKICVIYTSENTDVSPVVSIILRSCVTSSFMYCERFASSPEL